MKLHDIKKNELYKVPDRYFDQLPTRIQQRIETQPQGSVWSWSLALKLSAPAVAVALLVLIAVVWRSGGGHENAEALLASVEQNDIIAYLEMSDLDAEEIIASLPSSYSNMEFDDTPALVPSVELDEETLRSIMDEYGISESDI
jgi:hypothetical protein